MHVRLDFFGLDENGHNKNRGLYAWSDDGGGSFHLADGSPVSLPLTVNPSRGNAAVERQSSDRYWNVWVSLLEDAGFSARRW
jgi:hypothetical protein